LIGLLRVRPIPLAKPPPEDTFKKQIIFLFNFLIAQLIYSDDFEKFLPREKAISILIYLWDFCNCRNRSSNFLLCLVIQIFVIGGAYLANWGWISGVFDKAMWENLSGKA